MSFAQERIWVASNLDPLAPKYNSAVAFRMRGKLDLDALMKAFGRLQERHASLRTRFVNQDGEVLQIVDPAAELTEKPER